MHKLCCLFVYSIFTIVGKKLWKLQQWFHEKLGPCVKHTVNICYQLKTVQDNIFITGPYWSIIVFCKYMLLLNLMPVTHVKQVRRKGTKDWESCGMLQKHLFRTFHRFTGSLVTGHSNLWSWLGVKLASLIESAGVGQGSPLRETHDCVKEISTWAQEYFLKLHTVFKHGCWNRVVEGSAEK